MSSVSQIYFMNISGIEPDIAHIFEHAYIDATCKQLEKCCRAPASLLCNISATTFQKVILLNISAINDYTLSKLNNIVASCPKIDHARLNTYKFQIEAEEGKLYQIHDSVQFAESVNRLEGRCFQPVDSMSDTRLDRINYYKDLTTPNVLTSRKYPNSFDSITVNIDIDHPTIADRIILAAIKDCLTDIIRSSIGTLGGYTKSSFFNECTDDSILFKVNCIISRRADIKHLGNNIEYNIGKILGAPAKLQQSYLHANINTNFINDLYNYLGVLGSSEGLKQQLTLDNLLSTVNKLGVYSIFRQKATASDFNYDNPGSLFPR